ncbi:O-antigen ligase [Aquabacterium sp. NJ1]|uniref:O-antigen ligase family protein n=1 Tax=Aquabacterium sp. NJ1 TaxID=1538295 RepID=UPI00068A59DF|nr:O-antigen ligase family protein [Aquabacterium sp. NJ1]
MSLLPRLQLSASTLLPVLAGLLFGSLMLLGGPPALVGALVAVLTVVAILTRPVRGLLLFCLIAPFVPWTTVTIGIRMTVSEALLALTWAGVFTQWLMGRLPSWKAGPTERRMLWLMAWSIVPLVAGQYMVHEEGNGPVNWVRWLLNVSTLLLVPILTPTPALRQRMMDCLVIGFTAMLALSLGVFIKSPDARTMIPVLASLHYAHPEALMDIFSSMYNRMASPWVHPNSTGGVLLLGVPLAAFYGVSQTGWRRALSLFVALAGSAGIVFSGSRGALLCLAALVVWLAWRRVPMAGRALLIGTLLAATMLVAYPPARERLVSLTQGSQDASTSVRFDEYRNFHRAVERYPLGLGFKVETPATGGGVYGISNLWLNYWYKLGLPGMLFFIALTVAWWREVRLTGDLSKMKADQALHVGSVGAMLAALLTGFIDHYFSFTQVLIALFWLTMAISLQASRPLPQPVRETTPS